jgi:serine/threonine protein kinase
VSDEPPSLPPDLVDRYEVGRVLGEGGMGVVFLARDRRLERDVVIKVARSAAEGDILARARREARALSRVRHPHLLEVYQASVGPEGSFLVMEHVEGTPFSRLPPDHDWRGAFTQVAGALAALHGEGLVHRDVKPANILCERGGRVVLIDLGLVRDSRATRITRTGQVVGTMSYIAPEVLQGGAITPAADWFAWAVSFYQCLTRELPFSTAAVFAHLSERAPLQPDMAEVPEDLRDLLGRYLSAEPGDRMNPPEIPARAHGVYPAVSDPPAPTRALEPTRALRAWPESSEVAATTDLPDARRAPTRALPSVPPEPEPVHGATTRVMAAEVEPPTPAAFDRRKVGAGLAVVVLVAAVALTLALGRSPPGAPPPSSPSPTPRPPPSPPAPSPRPRAYIGLVKGLGDVGRILDQRLAALPRFISGKTGGWGWNTPLPGVLYETVEKYLPAFERAAADSTISPERELDLLEILGTIAVSPRPKSIEGQRVQARCQEIVDTLVPREEYPQVEPGGLSPWSGRDLLWPALVLPDEMRHRHERLEFMERLGLRRLIDKPESLVSDEVLRRHFSVAFPLPWHQGRGVRLVASAHEPTRLLVLSGQLALPLRVSREARRFPARWRKLMGDRMTVRAGPGVRAALLRDLGVDAEPPGGRVGRPVPDPVSRVARWIPPGAPAPDAALSDADSVDEARWNGLSGAELVVRFQQDRDALCDWLADPENGGTPWGSLRDMFDALSRLDEQERLQGRTPPFEASLCRTAPATSVGGFAVRRATLAP